MATTVKECSTERIVIRTTEAPVRRIRLAAKKAQTSVSTFVIESACVRAEEVLAAKTHLIYDAKQWDAFLAVLDRPAEIKPQLKVLLTEPSILDR